jgi:hypothetical protein
MLEEKHQPQEDPMIVYTPAGFLLCSARVEGQPWVKWEQSPCST